MMKANGHGLPLAKLALMAFVLQACTSNSAPTSVVDPTTSTARPTTTNLALDTTTSTATPTTTTSPTTTPLPATTTTTLPPTTTTIPLTPMERFEGAVLTLRSFGPLRIGATRGELRSDGVELAGDCVWNQVVDGPSNILVRVADNRVVLIVVDHEASESELPDPDWNPLVGVKTLSAIGIGSTEREVVATYGDKVELDEETRSLIFVPRDEADAHLRLGFVLDDQRLVFSMWTGEIDWRSQADC